MARSLLHVSVSQIDDQHLLGLLNELSTLREGRFPRIVQGDVFTFLTSFYLPDDQRAFQPIRSEHLLAEQYLTAKLKDLRTLSIYDLHLDLIQKDGGHHIEKLDNLKCYDVLNRLMRPHCKAIISMNRHSRPARRKRMF